jgi:hypothetical protein
VSAGGSAASRATQLRAEARRGLWRRVLAWLGWNPGARRREAVAARWDLGAAAEVTTAGLLEALHTRGWHVLHDRALPGSRANLDHVLVSPCGTALVVLDTKRWHARKPTRLVRGRVHCGTEDRHGQVEAVARYADRVARAAGLPVSAVWPLLVVHGSPIDGGRLEARVEAWPGPVWVLGSELLVPTLAASPQGRDPVRAAALAAHVARVLPPYPGGA